MPELVNHLGIALGDTPEEILGRLQRGDYTAADVAHDPARAASDPRYAEHVRAVDEDTPARFNADPSRLFEASGSAGKLCLFAVRLDTFPKEPSSVFYIGSNDPDDLTAVRRHLLTALPRLPIAGEYIHRTAYDIGERYGKDTFLLIDRFGTARVPAAFALKSRVDGFFERFGLRGVTDRVIQAAMGLLPCHLPTRMRQWRERYEHHLLVRVSNDTAEATKAFLASHFGGSTSGGWFECDAEEGRKAFLHRFAIAGAAIRYREVHRRDVEDIVALDVALRRNDRDWVEQLPADVEADVVHKLYYGHFFCHVFHQDYIVRKGVDPLAMEHRMWALLDARRAEYPAEHNVGHLYVAKPGLAGFYRGLDPSNTFNPGIGHTSRLRGWDACCADKPGVARRVCSAGATKPLHEKIRPDHRIGRCRAGVRTMRAVLGIVGLLVVLGIVGLTAKQMLSRPAVRVTPDAVTSAPAETPRQTTDRVKADLDDALRRAGERAPTRRPEAPPAADQTTPWASMASATFTKPAMLAPST